MPWFRGNLHTHTNLTDGDSPPQMVATWYDEAGYDFLCISDHNLRFDPALLQEEFKDQGRRLHFLPGEELTTWWQGEDRTYALHVNGYGTRTTLGEGVGESVSGVLQALIDRVVADGGFASVNHPNFWSSVSWSDLAGLQRLTFFEIYNGHPLSFNEGVGALPSMDAVWDLLLMNGQRVLGLAVDDAHYFQTWGVELSNPGRGWVMVEADEMATAPILAALATGRFYATTGPELVSIEARPGQSLRVVIDTPSMIDFIADGKVVQRDQGDAGLCRLGHSSYLRARITNSKGTAWVQPLMAN